MQQSLIAAVTTSEIIPEDARKQIESRVRKGLLGPLTVERESGPFMLYCCGDTFEDIAIKTNFPIDVLYVTAIHHNWEERSKSLKIKGKAFDPANLQKDLSHSILVATYMAAQEQLQDVLAGRKKASQCPLIPKNIHALERLMGMITALNSAEGSVPPGGTVVHAQNVQINQNSKEVPTVQNAEFVDEETEERKKERAEKYKLLRGD